MRATKTSSESPQILVIVVTFNAGEWIRPCIESTQNSSLPVDTIIIDNGSTDGTIETLKSEFSEIPCIFSPLNLGFGRANNIGLKKALAEEYDYVFLLNQDAWLQKDTLKHLILFHQSRREFGVLSPMHLNRTGNSIDPKFGYSLTTKSEQFRNDSFFKRLEPCYEVNFVNAALWLIPKETLQKIGGFNEFYFMYGEDGDYCARCIEHGMKVGVVTNAFAHHARHNHHYKSRPFLKNLLFHVNEWHSWSYETFLAFDRGFLAGIRASFHRIWIRTSQEIQKRRYTIAFGVILGWFWFLLSVRKAHRDKQMLKNEVKPHFIESCKEEGFEQS